MIHGTRSSVDRLMSTVTRLGVRVGAVALLARGDDVLQDAAAGEGRECRVSLPATTLGLETA